MSTAWLVAVVSSEGQAESIPDQEASLVAIAAEKGWNVTRTLSGVSTGRDGPRRLLRDLIGELRALTAAGRPAWLLMIRSDRIGRGRIVDSQVALHEIVDLGVRIWTREAGELKLDTATDQIISAVKAGLATLENEVKRDKAVAVYARRAKANLPLGNKAAYGLARTANGTLVAQEPQAEAVRAAFALRLEGWGHHRIAKHLATFAAPYAYRKGPRPIHWNGTRVVKLLRTRSYVGPIVDEVTFARVQRLFGEPRRRTATVHAWPLSGAIRCWCGRNLIGRATSLRKDPTGAETRFRYYSCPAIWNHRGKRAMYRAERVEDRFRALLKYLGERPGEIDAYRPAISSPSPALLANSLAEVQSAIGGLARERNAVWDLRATGAVRAADVQERLDVLTQRRRELEGRREEIERRIAETAAIAQTAAGAAELIARAGRLFANPKGTIEERRVLAFGVAQSLGGLYVASDGSLEIGTPAGTTWAHQRRANKPPL